MFSLDLSLLNAVDFNRQVVVFSPSFANPLTRIDFDFIQLGADWSLYVLLQFLGKVVFNESLWSRRFGSISLKQGREVLACGLQNIGYIYI